MALLKYVDELRVLADSHKYKLNIVWWKDKQGADISLVNTKGQTDCYISAIVSDDILYFSNLETVITSYPIYDDVKDDQQASYELRTSSIFNNIRAIFSNSMKVIHERKLLLFRKQYVIFDIDGHNERRYVGRVK